MNMRPADLDEDELSLGDVIAAMDLRLLQREAEAEPALVVIDDDLEDELAEVGVSNARARAGGSRC